MSSMEEIVPLVRRVIESDMGNDEQKSLSGLLTYYFTLFQMFKEDKYVDTIKFLSEKIFHPDNFTGTSHYTDSIFLLKELQKHQFLSEPALKAKEIIDGLLCEEAILLLNSSDLRSLYKFCKILCYFHVGFSYSDFYKQKLRDLLYEICPDEGRNFWDGNRFTHVTSKAFSLGLFEGFSGILILIMNCNSPEREDEFLKRIVKDGILYILSYKAEVDFTANKYAIFPNIVDIGNPPPAFTNQLNWHSSDLNIAVLLYRAAEFFKEKKLAGMADLIGLNTLLRTDYKSTGIQSSSLFDGSAGVAQSYRKLFELSQKEAYLEGYEYWIRQTIKYLKSELSNNTYLANDSDLLHGLPGPALTLLSYPFARNGEAEWSKHILLL